MLSEKFQRVLLHWANRSGPWIFLVTICIISLIPHSLLDTPHVKGLHHNPPPPPRPNRSSSFFLSLSLSLSLRSYSRKGRAVGCQQTFMREAEPARACQIRKYSKCWHRILTTTLGHPSSTIHPWVRKRLQDWKIQHTVNLSKLWERERINIASCFYLAPLL